MVAPAPWLPITANIEFDDQLGREPQLLQFFRGLPHAQALEHEQRILDVRVGQRLAQRRLGICRNECELHADAVALLRKPAHVVGCLLHDIDRAAAFRIHFGDPERLDLGLIRLHAVAEIRGLVRRAFRIDESRQIAADPDRVHVIEKERAVAAEEILDIMLRCRDEYVEPGFFHEPVEQSGIEGRGAVSRRVEHGPVSGGKGFHELAYQIRVRR